MKSFTLRILSCTFILLAFGMFSTNVEGGITIECPEGDKYKCYSDTNYTVYKGSGTSKVIRE
jgi:hypothetical protein